MSDPLGKTKRGEFSCYDSLGALYDPQVVQVSFKHSGGREELMTYGGSQSGDNKLERVSVGLYRWRYTPPIAGTWTLLERWSDTVSGETVTVYADRPFPIIISPPDRTWSDVVPA